VPLQVDNGAAKSLVADRRGARGPKVEDPRAPIARADGETPPGGIEADGGDGGGGARGVEGGVRAAARAREPARREGGGDRKEAGRAGRAGVEDLQGAVVGAGGDETVAGGPAEARHPGGGAAAAAAAGPTR